MSNPVNATVPIISSPLGSLPSSSTSTNTSTSRPSTSSPLPSQPSTNTTTTPGNTSGTTGNTSGTTGNPSGTTGSNSGTTGNSSSGTTGNTSSGTTGNTSSGTTGNTSTGTTGNTSSGTTGNTSSGTTGNTSSGTTGNTSSTTTGNTSGNTSGTNSGNNSRSNSSGTPTNGSSTNSSTPTNSNSPASTPTPAPNASGSLAQTTTIVRTITQGSGPQASIIVVTSTYSPQQTPGPGTHGGDDGGGGGIPKVITIAIPCAIGAVALLVALVLVVRWMRARSSAARAAEEIKWPEVVNSDGDRAALYPEPTRPAAGHGLGEDDEEITATGVAPGVGAAAGMGAGEMLNMAGTGAGGLGPKHSLSPSNTVSATYVGSQEHGYHYPAPFQPAAGYGGYYTASSPPHGYPAPVDDHLQPGYPPMARREPGYPTPEYYKQEYEEKDAEGAHKEMHSPPEPGYGGYPAQHHHRQQSGDQYQSHSSEHYQQQQVNHGSHSGPSSPVDDDYFNSGHGGGIGGPRRLVAINPDEPS